MTDRYQEGYFQGKQDKESELLPKLEHLIAENKRLGDDLVKLATEYRGEVKSRDRFIAAYKNSLSGTALINFERFALHWNRSDTDSTLHGTTADDSITYSPHRIEGTADD